MHDSRSSKGLSQMQVSATVATLELIEQLKTRYGADLLFHQSGGCCDGSSPMCFLRSDYQTGPQDILVGEIGGIPFYLNQEQYSRWQHTDLIIDVVTGYGGMFSLDNGTGKRFLTRSEICAI